MNLVVERWRFLCQREPKAALEMDQFLIILLTLRNLIGSESRSSRPTRNRRAPIRFSDEYARLCTLGSKIYPDEILQVRFT